MDVLKVVNFKHGYHISGYNHIDKYPTTSYIVFDGLNWTWMAHCVQREKHRRLPHRLSNIRRGGWESTPSYLLNPTECHKYEGRVQRAMVMIISEEQRLQDFLASWTRSLTSTAAVVTLQLKDNHKWATLLVEKELKNYWCRVPKNVISQLVVHLGEISSSSRLAPVPRRLHPLPGWWKR